MWGLLRHVLVEIAYPDMPFIQITINIGNEVRDQSKLLGSMVSYTP
jgi:hypothetical protein